MIEGGNVYTRGSKEASLGITEDHSQFYQELGENFSDKGNSKHKAMKQKRLWNVLQLLVSLVVV